MVGVLQKLNSITSILQSLNWVINAISYLWPFIIQIWLNIAIILSLVKYCYKTPPQGPLQESPVLLRTPCVQLISATRRYITSLRPQPLQSIAQRLVDSSNTYILQPLPPSHNITLRLFYHRRLAYNQFYISAILQALPEVACL